MFYADSYIACYSTQLLNLGEKEVVLRSLEFPKEGVGKLKNVQLCGDCVLFQFLPLRERITGAFTAFQTFITSKMGPKNHFNLASPLKQFYRAKNFHQLQFARVVETTKNDVFRRNTFFVQKKYWKLISHQPGFIYLLRRKGR